MPAPVNHVWRVRTLCAIGVLGLSAPAVSSAHFILESPPSWQSQDVLGLPEKLGPCGDESGGTPSGTVTAYQAGQTITVTIDEVITHPGHYRVALATNDVSELPAEPTVTPNNTPCGTVPVETNPTFPVLADGLFTHTTAFTSPQSAQITLPANVTCTHCTLQVIEFMSDHALNVPGGCFYHHCANISISAPGDGGLPAVMDAGTTIVGTRDAGTTIVGTRDAGTTVEGTTDAGSSQEGAPDAGAPVSPTAGCQCSGPGDASSIASALGLATLLAAVRRRRFAARG